MSVARGEVGPGVYEKLGGGQVVLRHGVVERRSAARIGSVQLRRTVRRAVTVRRPLASVALASPSPPDADADARESGRVGGTGVEGGTSGAFDAALRGLVDIAAAGVSVLVACGCSRLAAAAHFWYAAASRVSGESSCNRYSIVAQL